MTNLYYGGGFTEEQIKQHCIPMKQFYAFENEQGDWTICYGEDHNDFDSQIICAVDDHSKETAQSLNSIVDGLNAVINERDESIKELQADILDLTNANERLTREIDLLDSKLEELQEGLTEARNDYQDICELAGQIALPFGRESLMLSVGPENYDRFKNHIGW